MGLPKLLLAAVLSGGVLGSCAPALFPDVPGRDDSAVAVVKRLGWGTPEAFAAARPRLEPLWPALDWENNGCSAPQGLGLGYRDDFAPACVVHDFAYHNLRVLEPTAANRRASDEAFRANLRAICARHPPAAQPACFSAAEAYFWAVRWRGQTRFAPGT
ncbi:phospholipase A2 [Deinococcus murrayi]|uniref:phospholipase A2 n=1 Tax=Deinococcus murrayi TaxID=68910 RepID=UPI000685AF5C|nr:phospholipase A2 [Deinococcus murrayi]